MTVPIRPERPKSALELALEILAKRNDDVPRPNEPSAGRRLAAAIGGGTGLLDLMERAKLPAIGPLDTSDRARSAWTDAASIGLMGGGGLSTEKITTSNRKAELLNRMAGPKRAGGLTVVDNVPDMFVHGTSAENAEKILLSGEINPSAGVRQYRDLDFGRDAAYVGRGGRTPWTDAQMAEDARAVPYTDYLGVKLSPEARMLRLETADDAERFARAFGARPVRYPSGWVGTAAQEAHRVFMDEVGDLYYSGGGVPEHAVRASNALDKLRRGWGIDVLDIAPDAANAMQTAAQTVLISPSKAKVVGRIDPKSLKILDKLVAMFMAGAAAKSAQEP